MGRSLRLIAILAFASLAVTACGKRGTLEAPGTTEGDATKTSADQPKKPGMVSAKSENAAGHRDFVLDGMLR